MINHLPILIIIFPLLVAFIILIFKKYFIILSIISILFSLISLLQYLPSVLIESEILYHIGGWSSPIGITIKIDSLSFLFSFMILFVGLLVIIYSIPKKEYKYNYYFLQLLLLSSMLGTVFTADIFNMYILYDLVAISTYLLISYHQEVKAIKASLTYLLMSAVGLSLFLLGVGSLYSMAGTLDISGISEQIPVIFLHNPKIVIMSLVLIITSMGIKMAMVPLHSWLPEAHSMAPSPVSAILSGVVVKIGFYCIIRLIFNLFGSEKALVSISNNNILMLFGTITLLFGAMMALVQTDLKRMLAYSTINQIGLILIGVSMSNVTGLEGSFFHVLNHALLKSALFLCAGIIIIQTGSREIRHFAGYGKKNPLIAFSFVILSIGIIGIPPMNGFVSKFLISLSAIQANYDIIALIVVFSSLITAAYYFRVIQVLYSNPVQANNTITEAYTEKNITNTNNNFELAPICILMGISLLMGIYPAFGLSVIQPSVKMLLSIILK